MNYEVIKSRHSVRSFTDAPIAADVKRLLDAAVAQCNSDGGLSIKFVTEEPEAFGKSLLAHYGKFVNVRNYFCLIARRESGAEERVGRYGEMLVLKAQELGLNTCWVGMTFAKGRIPVEIAKGEKLYAVIAVGYGQNQGAEHRVKTPDQICREIAETPDWFRRGVDCALLAPTAVNQQKFRFKWLGGGAVSASTGWGFFSKVDLGIAKLHFELGASPVEVDWR